MIYGYAISGGGSGKAGATLTVTAPLGSTVTVSKGSESYSSALRPAVFAGLSTGTWIIDYTDGPNVGQASVDITADYATEVSYFSATINVTYPSGSTCTVTNGSVTLNAPDTSGTWSCTVPEAGTWTVTATDGTNTKSETVEITQSGESVSVELAYWDGNLYNAGEEYATVTGGWEKVSSTGTVTKNTGTIEVSPPASYNGYVKLATSNKINLADWSTLNISITGKSVAQTYAYLRVVTDVESSTQLAKCSLTTGTGAGTFSLDVSGITEPCFVMVYVQNRDTTTKYVTFDRIWLE